MKVTAISLSGEHSFLLKEPIYTMFHPSNHYQTFKDSKCTRFECIQYLGQKFRSTLRYPDWKSNYECGEYLLRNMAFVHLNDGKEKFDVLLMMLHKLYAFVSDN